MSRVYHRPRLHLGLKSVVPYGSHSVYQSVEMCKLCVHRRVPLLSVFLSWPSCNASALQITESAAHARVAPDVRDEAQISTLAKFSPPTMLLCIRVILPTSMHRVRQLASSVSHSVVIPTRCQVYKTVYRCNFKATEVYSAFSAEIAHIVRFFSSKKWQLVSPPYLQVVMRVYVHG